MGPTQPHNYREPSALSAGLKLPEPEADHSLRHSAILWLPSLCRDNLILAFIFDYCFEKLNKNIYAFWMQNPLSL